MKSLQKQQQELTQIQFQQGIEKLGKLITKEETNTLILHSSKIKFRDYTESNVKAVLSEFNKVSLLIGVNTHLEDWAALELLKFCVSEFKDFSFSEILEAANKYNAGKLDFKEGHFQNLSNRFLGSLLNSYRSYRNKILMKYHKEMQKVEDEKEPTEEEKQQIHKEYLTQILFNPYKKALESSEYLNFDQTNGLILFREGYKKGILKPTKEELQRFKEAAIERLSSPVKTVLNKHDVKALNLLIKSLRLVYTGSGDEKTETLVKEKAASLFFVDWVNKQVELKTDLVKVWN